MTGLGRFAEPGVLILASLADGPKHGYALIKDIEGFAGARLRDRGPCTRRWPAWKAAGWSRHCRSRTGAARTS